VKKRGEVKLVSKNFKPGLIYVFTMKKYIKDGRNKHSIWAKEANGRKVDIESELTENGYAVAPWWCKCIGLDRRKQY
jgi:hypothetical protein